jgi:prolyl 4-hydroxylase
MRELIRVIDVLPEHYCRHLIDKFERSRPEQTAGAAVDAGWNKADRMTGWRELNLSANPERWECEIATFTTVIDRVAREYQRLVGQTLPQAYRLGPLRIKKYEAAQGHRFAPHTDANSMRDAPRFLALLFYLNTVVEGGETEFMNLNVVVPPRAGSVMVFPPFWMFPHAGRTPRSNDKYVLGTYLHYPIGPRNTDPRERGLA